MVIVCIAVVARLVYAAVGVRFDVLPTSFYWQFLDLGALQNNLGDALLYLHAQPPLMNAATGLALKLFGPRAPVVFHFVLAGIGILFILAFYDLASRALRSRKGALAVTLVLIAHPSYVVLENNCFYTIPVIALLTCALLSLEHYARTGLSTWLLAYGLACGFLVLLRSMYHPLWLLVMLTLPLCIRKPRMRYVLVQLALFVAVIVWPLKNYFLLGCFTTSSWSGMNLFNTVYSQSYTEEEIRRFYRGGGLQPRRPKGSTSELGTVRPFAAPDLYAALITYSPVGHEVLDRAYRESGSPNYNHGIYLAVSKVYFRDYLRVVRTDPWILLRVLRSSLGYFFRTPGDYEVLYLTPVGRENLRTTRLMDALYRTLYYWQPESPELDQSLPSPWRLVSYSMLGITVILMLGLPWLALRVSDADVRGIALFVWLNTSYVVLIGNLCENYENMRFRFEIEAVCLVGLMLIVGHRRQLLARRGGAPIDAGTALDPGVCVVEEGNEVEKTTQLNPGERFPVSWSGSKRVGSHQV